MIEVALHHVSVPTSNLSESSRFYEKVLGLKPMQRPPFTVDGVWYAIGRLQIHVVVHLDANFRTGKAVDNDDVHFALRAEDFEQAVTHLKKHGFDEGFAGDHPKRLILKRTGLAGFPQLFVMDPDRNVIEINGASFNSV
jgi:catechol 2,3-dioxygenase-like lactoylglutathione lyase family enzyme